MNNAARKISIYEGNIVFLIGACVLFVFNTIVRTRKADFNINSTWSLVMEVCFFLLPSLILLIINKKDIVYILRINKISIKNVILIIGIMLFSLPIIGIINVVVNYFIIKIGRPLPYEVPAINTGEELILAAIIIALSPAICEEVMFRGVILRAYERQGNAKMIAASAILFAILHRNIQNLFALIFIGAIMTYFVYRTDSIFASIIAHFTNNLTASVFSFFIHKNIPDKEIDIEQEVNSLQNLGLIEIASIVFFLTICILIFWGLLLSFRSSTEKVNRERIYIQGGKRKGIYSYIPLIVGLILISYEYINQILYIIS